MSYFITWNIIADFFSLVKKKVEFSKNFHNLFSETFQKIAERTGCFPNVSQELLVKKTKKWSLVI